MQSRFLVILIIRTLVIRISPSCRMSTIFIRTLSVCLLETYVLVCGVFLYLRACIYAAGWPVNELAHHRASPGLYERFDGEPAPRQPAIRRPGPVFLLCKIGRTRKYFLFFQYYKRRNGASKALGGKRNTATASQAGWPVSSVKMRRDLGARFDKRDLSKVGQPAYIKTQTDVFKVVTRYIGFHLKASQPASYKQALYDTKFGFRSLKAKLLTE